MAEFRAASMTLARVDPGSRTITATLALASTPGYVRYVAPTNEVWISEPEASQIEIVSIAAEDGGVELAHAGSISVAGAESLEIDALHGLAFTNTATLTEASLGPFVSQATAIYHCPSDRALSTAQSAAGWDRRIRSYSMNAMVGDAGDSSANGFNINNPGYVQFFKVTQIPQPTEIFVFLDEHPNTIDDGYFLDKSTEYDESSAYGGSGPNSAEWRDLPATYHNNATAFSFADGHSTLHRWMVPSTIYPVQPDVPYIPIDISANQRMDFDWILSHMSVDQN